MRKSIKIDLSDNTTYGELAERLLPALSTMLQNGLIKGYRLGPYSAGNLTSNDIERFKIDGSIKKYAIHEVLENVPLEKTKHEEYQYFDCNRVRTTSDRYRNFKKNGVKCIKCGFEGQYFILERPIVKRPKSKIGWHFNLYGLDKFGHEIMLTRDHIIPLSLDGPDELSNLQPMCAPCNFDKGSAIEWPGGPLEIIQI